MNFFRTLLNARASASQHALPATANPRPAASAGCHPDARRAAAQAQERMALYALFGVGR